MRRLTEFVTDSRLSVTEEMDMSTLIGATIRGSRGVILARVRRLSPSCYLWEEVPAADDGYLSEVLAAHTIAQTITDYLNEYFSSGG